MKIKVNGFLELGVCTLIGTLTAFGATNLAQNAELIAPATNVLFSSNAAFGIGLLGAFVGVLPARLAIEHFKDKQNENTPIQFTGKKLKI